MTDNDLENFIKQNAKFLSIQEGQTVMLIYKGYTIVDDRFNPGKKVVSYLFQWPGTDKNVPWNKASSKVAAEMIRYGAGDTLEITRIGSGPQTNYKIRKIS